jgi:hypothetical protein
MLLLLLLLLPLAQQSHLQLACLLLQPGCSNPAGPVVGVGGDHTLQQQPRLCSSNKDSTVHLVNTPAPTPPETQYGCSVPALFNQVHATYINSLMYGYARHMEELIRRQPYFFSILLLPGSPF